MGTEYVVIVTARNVFACDACTGLLVQNVHFWPGIMYACPRDEMFIIFFEYSEEGANLLSLDTGTACTHLLLHFDDINNLRVVAVCHDRWLVYQKCQFGKGFVLIIINLQNFHFADGYFSSF